MNSGKIENTSLFICFTGIDGSGKTLQARKLLDTLSARGISCDYVWCRYSPRVLAPLMWIAKRMMRKGKGKSDYKAFTSSKRGLMSKPVVGAVWRHVSSMEYSLQARFTIRPRLRKGTILLCDRYVYDMIADLSINLGLKEDGMTDLLNHPALQLIPRPDHVFFLEIPPDVSLARKNDPNVMGREYLVDRADRYDFMCRKLGFIRVDATRSIDEIADDILAKTISFNQRIGSEATVE